MDQDFDALLIIGDYLMSVGAFSVNDFQNYIIRNHVLNPFV